MRRAVGWMLLGLSACKQSPEAPLSFSDTIVGTFQKFEGDDAEVAAMMRALESQVYVNMEVDAKDVLKRAVAQGALVEADIAPLPESPDRDPAALLPVATAWASPHGIDDHAALTVMDDQCHLEGASPAPSDFVRTVLEGEDCWTSRDCTWLKTTQDVIKHYAGGIVPPIPYVFLKDFRWVDLNLGLEGATGSRWGYVARSYNPGSYSDEKSGKNTIWASYTIEAWFPRDGDGFTWEDAPEGVLPLGDDAGDSTNGGTLRFLALWTESEIALSDDPNILTGTIRWGMDQNYAKVDGYLDDPSQECDPDPG